ncbi:hypothetical protein X801_08460, partial [Opisthorchis viverrini]
WRASSTKTSTGQKFVIGYPAGEYEGIWLRETIREYGDKCSSLPFDGIMGLCFDAENSTIEPQLLDQFVAKGVIETPIISIWLNP